MLRLLSPFIRDPSATPAILLHSATGPILLFGLVLAVILFAGRRRIARAERRAELGDAENRPQSPKSRWKAYAFIIVFVFLVLGAPIIVPAAMNYRTGTELQRYGQRTIADVVRTYDTGCSHGRCSFNVEYQFTPTTGKTQSAPVVGYDYLGSTGYGRQPRLDYVQIHHTVPIAYDPADPSVSALNFNDTVFRADHGKVLRLMLGTVALLFLLLTATFGGAVAYVRWKQNRLQPYS